MRVISGRYRGLKLNEFEGDSIRPTADRVKESLFNILYPKIAGAVCLDLFCGSGSLGIECLSRGAKHVDFNDISPASVKVLRGNLSRIKDTNYTVTTGDYASFLKSSRCRYDIIFIDPPYGADLFKPALKNIIRQGWLADEGFLVAEVEKGLPLKADAQYNLTLEAERLYGNTRILVWVKNA